MSRSDRSRARGSCPEHTERSRYADACSSYRKPEPVEAKGPDYFGPKKLPRKPLDLPHVPGIS